MQGGVLPLCYTRSWDSVVLKKNWENCDAGETEGVEIIELLRRAFVSATERDVKTGDYLEIFSLRRTGMGQGGIRYKEGLGSSPTCGASTKVEQPLNMVLGAALLYAGRAKCDSGPPKLETDAKLEIKIFGAAELFSRVFLPEGV